MIKRILTAGVLLLLSCSLSVARETRRIDTGWKFRLSSQVAKGSEVPVTLPHTWNAEDVMGGNPDYARGIGNYTRELTIPEELQGKRIFIRFAGSFSVTDVFLDGKFVGEHRGGYGAFVFELTDRIRFGESQKLLVRVNNAPQLDIMPLVGDFNFYGGIYREVEIIATEPMCISLTDYASPGVYLIQESVSEKKADLTARVITDGEMSGRKKLTLTLKDAEGKTVATKKQTIESAGSYDIPLQVRNPHLWNGTEDPYMYSVDVTLSVDERVVDSISQPLGLRYFSFSPEEGFFLNGRHLPLRGVCRHQEIEGLANAIQQEHHIQDVALMQEMGVNAVRCSHYPQASEFYSLLDEAGMIAWAEIPFVGPGGYADKGFVNSPAFRENGRLQLIELIRQHYNHPSIVCWGLFNELNQIGDDPVEYISELNELAHKEDPTRPTTAASNVSGKINSVTDLIAWNRYDGWYGNTTATLANWLDKTHKANPEYRIAISEYGAGASIQHQQDTLVQSIPTSRWHPENWQTQYHIENWKIISSRPYVWGSFVWNMFDFGAAHRTEGDRLGINDKGLVTRDRQIRKDAFWFYKANWNPEPMVRIEGHRNNQRKKSSTDVRIFSNAPEVELMLNGVSLGKRATDQVNIVSFPVELAEGDNELEAKAYFDDGTVVIDTTVWTLNNIK